MRVGSGDIGAIVAAASAGQSLAQIAAAGGVSVSTAQRRLRQKDVQDAIREENVRTRREATARLASMRATALERLETLMADPDPRTSLRAVALVLGSSVKFDALYDLDGRISALESEHAEADQDVIPGDDGDSDDPE